MNRSGHTQKSVVYLLCITILPVVVIAYSSWEEPSTAEVNLTDWREHRRKKRFILFADSGTVKIVCSMSFPIDLHDKKNWRQLVTTYNLHYQYNLPGTLINWWDQWDRRNLPNDVAPIPPEEQRDEAQVFLYEFAENMMDHRQMNGRECLLKAICENAQIHVHQGLYAELLHRWLRPHRNLDSHYVDAWEMGLKGIDCQAAFAKATNCLLDQYTHVREEFMDQTSVK